MQPRKDIRPRDCGDDNYPGDEDDEEMRPGHDEDDDQCYQDQWWRWWSMLPGPMSNDEDDDQCYQDQCPVSTVERDDHNSRGEY